MKTLLIGHRGSGKTSLLTRVESYYRDAGRALRVWDLDRQIESRYGSSLKELIASKGEAAFRKYEMEVLDALVAESKDVIEDVFVAAGAGFEGEVPTGWRCVWVRRVTDDLGRIFLGRPRLEPEVPPLVEFHNRRLKREDRYRQMATDMLWISEGFDFANAAERCWIMNDIRELDADLTCRSEEFLDIERASLRWSQRLEWGVRRFELRDDLLTPEQIKTALEILPPAKVLVSFRDPGRSSETRRQVEKIGVAMDWPLELGSPPADASIVSIHRRGEGRSLEAVLHEIDAHSASGRLLKVAVEIRDFKELAIGHAWREADPATRVFLPCSEDGRWEWYRLWLKGRSALNFIREDDGLVGDQPSLIKWLRRGTRREFAAILGDPISHSRTPAEQFAFFAEVGLDVLGVRVPLVEWYPAIDFLQKQGLRFAAITSPLKKIASQSCQKLTSTRRARPVNTFVWRNDHWLGANTDRGGFVLALQKLKQEMGFDPREVSTVIWGGGGTRGAMTLSLPRAVPYSARTREPVPGRGKKVSSPRLLIWAVGRETWREAALEWPSADWRPEVIFDLNYSEDSPGLEYAMRCGARYFSGLEMFGAQAEGQRAFWRAYVGEYVR